MSLSRAVRNPWCIAATLALAVGCVAMSPAAGGPDYDLGTVAKKYHFSFTGQKGSGDNYAAVGWIQIGDGGSVTAGHVETAYALGDNNAFIQDSLDLTTNFPLSISVQDSTNGVYNLFLRFDATNRTAVFTTKVILDSAHGNTGKMCGSFNFFSGATGGGGVGLGEITAP